MSTRAGRSFGIRGWIRVGVSIALLVALLFILDLGGVGAALFSASPLLLLLLLFIVYGERLYSALRWYQVLRWSSANVPLPAVVRITFISAFAGLFLPGVVGTETFRVLGLAKYSADLPMAFSSVLVDRMLALLTLIPLVLIGVALAPPGVPAGLLTFAWIAMGLVVAAGFLMLHRAPRKLLDLLMPDVLAARVRPRLDRLYFALDAYRRRPLMLLYAVVLAFGFQLLRVAVVGVSVAAVGVQVHIAYFFIFAPILVFMTMAPISFAGIGAREATYVYLFSLIGVAAEKAFAASILVQFIGLVSCLPGAWLYARGMQAKPKAKEVPLCERSSQEQPVS